MKKLISILLSIAILSGMCISSSAEYADGQTVDKHSAGIEVAADTNYFFNYEEFHLMITLGGADADEVETAYIYIDCNKDVLKYTGERNISSTENTVFVVDETESGYLVTYTCKPDAGGCVYNFVAYCTFEITGIDSPDISVRCTKKLFGQKMKHVTVSLILPDNIVYEKDIVPHIVTDLKAPVFGERVTFNACGRIYLYAPQTVNQILSMLSSSDGASPVKHIPFDGTDRDYVTTGDSFVLEFGGRKCEEIFVELKGDADLDGIITSKDARLALRYSAGLDDNTDSCADVTCDGEITAADARMILRVAAKIDYFRHKDVVIWVNQKFKVGPLESASDGGYMWRCTVSEEGAIEVTETIEPSVDNTGKAPDAIVLGAPALQTFVLKPLKQGKFDVHFELIRSWEDEPIEEFGFTVVVDGILQ